MPEKHYYCRLHWPVIASIINLVDIIIVSVYLGIFGYL